MEISKDALKALSKDELAQMWFLSERERCQKDLMYLCREYLGYRDLNDDLHDPIADALKVKEDILVLIPRGHLKSSLIAVGKTIQFILNNQNVRIKIVSYAYKKAVEIVTEIKQQLKNPRLISLFGEILYQDPDGQSDSWRENMFNVKRTCVVAGATVEGLGVLSGNVGQHCEIIIFDDVHDSKNTATLDLITKTKDKCNAFLAVLEPGGLRIWLGTRWMREDKYAELIKDGVDITHGLVQVPPGKLRYIRREDIENGHVIFPEKFNFKILSKIKKELGTSFYYKQYKNRVMSEEDVIVRERWIKDFTDIPEDKPWSRAYIMCDPAISEARRSCESVVQTIGQSEDNHLWVYRSKGFRTSQIQTIVDAIFYEYLKYCRIMDVVVAIETVAFQKSLKQWIEREQITNNLYFEVVELEPHSRNKDLRIKRLGPMFERGVMHIRTAGCESLKSQLLDYGGTVLIDHADCLGYLPDVIMESSGYDVAEMQEEESDPFSFEAVIESEAEYSYLDY